jgi:hypothetical protein
MAGMANSVIEFGSERLTPTDGSAFDVALKLIPSEQREQVIERAAIMESDGELQRAEAEKAALKLWARAQSDQKYQPVN